MSAEYPTREEQERLFKEEQGKIVAIFRTINANWKLIEDLSSVIHEYWVQAIKHLLSNMSTENIIRWEKRSKTPYNKLTKEEQQECHVWTFKLLKIMLLHGYDVKNLEELQKTSGK